MPITRSGRPVAAASVEIGIEDVFDASTASGGSVSSARRKTSSFTAASSTTASIIRSAGDELLDGLDAAEHLVRIGPALLGELAEARRIVSRPRSTAPGRRVVERDAPAGARDDLRDPAAHLARADDEDVLEIQSQTSIRSASPWPPPEQIAASPSPPPLRRSSWTIVADDPRARGADRVAERDGAAVHVHLLRVGAEHLAPS